MLCVPPIVPQRGLNVIVSVNIKLCITVFFYSSVMPRYRKTTRVEGASPPFSSSFDGLLKYLYAFIQLSDKGSFYKVVLVLEISQNGLNRFRLYTVYNICIYLRTNVL